ncbi:MAG: phytoene/squalene synthase family protein, partial [Bryocella sp.]
MSQQSQNAQSAEIAAAYTACREIARREARNFYYAFRVLPQHKSDAMCAVYAFMRKADDLADDESLSLDARREAMAAWTGAWRASRTQATSDPIFRALQDTQQRFAIQDSLLEQLVAGTTLDLNPQPAGVLNLAITSADGTVHQLQVYENFAALHHYCYLVASVVGLVCIKIFGYSDRRAEQLAIDTGIAFQLTNILRDVREDVERGRVYLPADQLEQHQVTPQHLLATISGAVPETNLITLFRGLELHAQTMYRSSTELIPMLDPDSRP